MSLKYPLPDAEWREIVLALTEMALSKDVSITRRTALLTTVGKLCAKRRALGTVTLPWRPFWELLQSGFLSHLNSRSMASNQVVSDYMRHLIYVSQVASRYFPDGTVAELCAVTGPSFAHVNARAPFNAQAMLYILLPVMTRMEDLPPGTAEYWMQVWATVDHCHA